MPWCQISDLQNYGTMYFCCFKLSSCGMLLSYLSEMNAVPLNAVPLFPGFVMCISFSTRVHTEQPNSSGPWSVLTRLSVLGLDYTYCSRASCLVLFACGLYLVCLQPPQLNHHCACVHECEEGKRPHGSSPSTGDRWPPAVDKGLF